MIFIFSIVTAKGPSESSTSMIRTVFSKKSVSALVAVFLGASTIAFMVSTIVLSTKYNNKKSDYNELVAFQGASVGSAFSSSFDNVCEGKGTDIKLENQNCEVLEFSPQSGTDVSSGYVGNVDMESQEIFPVTDPYYKLGMCPVNVHWHLGAEHRSEGEFDEDGHGPDSKDHRRALAGEARLGFRCHHYDESDKRFTTEYEWKHCTDMHVGETYEVHWPHSSFGACGTPFQYQTPFYDGVLCKVPDLEAVVAAVGAKVLHQNVGVQGQVFTIINDEDYYYPDLIKGMIVDDVNEMGKHITSYTGSTTGTSRDNEMCSSYSPINWQVDRKCHIISASSFDKLCADMKAQVDDMADDLYPHGSRELVADDYAANNHVNRKLLRVSK